MCVCMHCVCSGSELIFYLVPPQVTSIVRAVSSRRLLALRLHTQLLWNKYFKSVENVVMTTLEVLINVVTNTIKINDCLPREHIIRCWLWCVTVQQNHLAVC